MKLNATVFNLLFLIFFIINKNYFYIFWCNFFLKKIIIFFIYNLKQEKIFSFPWYIFGYIDEIYILLFFSFLHNDYSFIIVLLYYYSRNAYQVNQSVIICNGDDQKMHTYIIFEGILGSQTVQVISQSLFYFT
jgi:hypothetical protein